MTIHAAFPTLFAVHLVQARVESAASLTAARVEGETMSLRA